MHPILEQLVTVRRQAKRLVVAHGVCRLLTVLLAVGIVLAGIDYLMRWQDPGMRLLATLTLLGSLAAMGYWTLIRSLRVPLTELALAKSLARRYPELGDGLVSTVEFLQQPEADDTGGSAAMRRAVIAETTAASERLDFSTTIDPRPTYRAALVCTAAILIVAWIATSRPMVARTAVVRLVAPFSNQAWPRTHHLRLWGRDHRVAAGQAFEVEAVDRHGVRPPRDARIIYRFVGPGGGMIEQAEPMQWIAPEVATTGWSETMARHRAAGVLYARRENVTAPFFFRIVGGDDDQMAWRVARVYPPPRIASLEIELVPPEYTGHVPRRTNPPLVALRGTQSRITAQSTKPLEAAYLRLDDGQRVACEIRGEDRRELQVSFTVETSGNFGFELDDLELPPVETEQRFEIRAIRDEPPGVFLEEPGESIYVTAAAVVPLRLTATDDLAIRRIRLRHQVGAGDDEAASLLLYEGPTSVPQADSDPELSVADRREIAYDWQLRGLHLEPPAKVDLWIEAEDYLGQWGHGEKCRLIVVSEEELAERLSLRQATILGQLDQTLESQKACRQSVAAIMAYLEAAGTLPRQRVDQLRAAELSQQHIRTMLVDPIEGLPSQIGGLLADLRNNRVDNPGARRRMEDLRAQLETLHAEHLSKIDVELNRAVKGALVRWTPVEEDSPANDGSAQAVLGPLGVARSHQDGIVQHLEQLLDRLSRWNDYRRYHRDVSHLLRDQEALHQETQSLSPRLLGARVEDLPSADAAALAVLSSRQQELARQLDRAGDALATMADRMRDGDPLVAQTLEDAAAEIQLAQIGPQMRQVSEDLRQNRMGKALAGQETILPKLRSVLDILANRREHELARLMRSLEDAGERLAEIRRRQTGLADAMQGATPADLERLGAKQTELRAETERLARQLDRLTAEATTERLREASARMQRAAESAEQRRSDEAHTAALAAAEAIEAGQRELARQAAEAKADLARERIEQFRDRMEGLRLRQVQLLRETERLDRLRVVGEERPSAEQATLENVARQQRRLAEDTADFAEGLEGTEVMRLVVTRTVDDMVRAADGLAEGDTGPHVRGLQQAIVDRFARVLESLEQEQSREPQPDSQNTGQEGGPQQTPGDSPEEAMRALAELKLLRLLQDDVNRRTQALADQHGTLDRLPPEVSETLDALSQEQGELADLMWNLLPVVQAGQTQAAERAGGLDRDDNQDAPQEGGSL